MSIKALAAKKALGLTSIAGVTSTGVLAKELITSNVRFEEDVKRGITHGNQDKFKTLEDIIKQLNEKVNKLEETKLKQEIEIKSLQDQKQGLKEEVALKEKTIKDKDNLVAAYSKMVIEEKLKTAKAEQMREQDNNNCKETLKSLQQSMAYLSRS